MGAATILTKARDILPGNRDRSSSSPSERSIPPEPVQQQPNGDFRHQEQGPALQTVNLARANKRCGGLSWDTHLAEDAQTWADQLAQSNGDSASLHREKSAVQEQGEAVQVFPAPGGPAGKSSTDEPTYENAIQTWLEHEKHYDGSPIASGEGEDWQQYTQCMWQNTQHIGMGKAQSADGSWYVVARFTPRGNVQGEMPF